MKIRSHTEPFLPLSPPHKSTPLSLPINASIPLPGGKPGVASEQTCYLWRPRNSSLCREGRKTMGRLVFVSFGLLVVFLSLSGTGADFDCPSGWSAYDQYCYKPFNEPQNWDDAERFCSEQAKGGHLVSIESDGEAGFVAQLVAENIQRPEFYVWIGLRVRRKEQQCSTKWSDGSSIIYVNWNKGESQMCQGLSKWTNFLQWYNTDCEAKNPFVCKFPPEC